MIIKSINISEKKGEVKNPVEAILITQTGLQHDAHAEPSHHQVSILGSNSISRFEKTHGRSITPGEFAENITLNDFEVQMVGPLDVFKSVNVVLEVTQIGKKCHGANCVYFNKQEIV